MGKNIIVYLFERLQTALPSWLLALLASVSAYAQKPSAHFQNFGVEQGLSQTQINDVITDQQGYLWVATSDGLNRYDGYRFAIYRNDQRDPNSLSDNEVHDLFLDSKKRLWVGTGAGLNLYSPETDNFFRYLSDETNQESLSDNNIESITEDPAGNIWLGTQNGLNKLNPATGLAKQYFFAEDVPTTIPDNSISQVYADKSGFIWISTFEMGLCRYLPGGNGKPESFERHHLVPPGQPGHEEADRIRSIFQDSKGRLWIGGMGGLFKAVQTINPGTGVREVKFVSQNDKKGLSGNKLIFAIGEDSKSRLWLGSQEGLLYLDDKEAGTAFSFTKDEKDGFSLPHDKILSLYDDRKGSFWVGTANGLSQMEQNKENFELLKHIAESPNSLAGSSVNAIMEDKEGFWWIGLSGKGITRYSPNNKTFNHYAHSPSNQRSLPHATVYSLREDRKGGIWVGTEAGLCQYLPSQDGFITHKPDKGPIKISNAVVLCLEEDKEGYIWAGTVNGLNKINPSTYETTHFLHDAGNDASISFDIVSCLMYDNEDNMLWVGTPSGLNLFDLQYPERGAVHFFNNEADSASLTNSSISAIFRDSRGEVWVGTESGLNLLTNRQKGIFRRFGMAEGLPNEVIYGLREDQAGRVWASTNKGLARFDPLTGRFVIYDQRHGLQSDEFNQGATGKSRNGQLMFGGVAGLNFFYGENIKENPYQPESLITALQIFNKKEDIGTGESILTKNISLTDEITLSYKHSVFSLEYVALSFVQSEKTHYAYMLEGFDEDWNMVGDRKAATYTNLDAGTYIFKVKAANNDGLWEETPAQLTIHITPPFWKRWWFRVALIIAVVSYAYRWYKIRIYRVQSQKSILEKQVKERTEKIMNQADLIKSKNNTLENQKNEIARHRDALMKSNQEMQAQKDKIEATYQNLKTLSEIGRKITALLAVEPITETAYENLNSLMDAPLFGLGLFDPKTQQINFEGFIERGRKLPFSFDKSNDDNRLSAWCLNNRKDVLVNDFSMEYKNYIFQIKPPNQGGQAISIIYVPLVSSKDETVGVLTVQSFKRNAYSEHHLTIVRNLALYIQIALENSAAYRQIATQKTDIDRKNNDINASKEYAERIQHAILPPMAEIKRSFPHSFVFFKPKETVSGDFYWHAQKTGADGIQKNIFAVVDCTGHGVPGAFMSMIGNDLLNEVVNILGVLSPEAILEEMHKGLRLSLNQETSFNHDGMELAIFAYAPANDTLEFAGAKSPMIYVKPDENGKPANHYIKGDNMPVGGFMFTNTRKYTKHSISIDATTMVYMFSDGFQDQFGGDKGEKFMSGNLRHLLGQLYPYSLDEQEQTLKETLAIWMDGKYAQLDDILVVGFRLSPNR